MPLDFVIYEVFMKADTLRKTYIAALLAMLCSALWGSAFPCVKIGYGLFSVDTANPASLILFAGVRFFIAGIMVIIIGSIMHKKPMIPKLREVPKVISLSLFQTILQYLFFYIGLANTSGVKSSVIEGMSVFVCILISSLIPSGKADMAQDNRLCIRHRGYYRDQSRQLAAQRIQSYR